MPKRITKKEKAYRLFSEGKDSSSPEVKALGMKSGTRYVYYSMWQKEGRPSPAPSTPFVSEKEIKESRKPAKAKTYLPGGESINPISEVPDEKLIEMDELPSGELKEKETKLKGEKVLVVGEGLTVTVIISVKTLALYQIAASMQGDDLTLGDFIDVCVEDTFRGRGKDLGLINLGGNQ